MVRKILLVASLSLMVSMPAFAQNAAVVNGKPIPSAKIDELIAEMKRQGAPETPELRNQIRDELVMREIFVQEAQKQKITDRTDVKLAVENARQRILMSALAQEFLKKNPISDADVTAEYDAAKAKSGGLEYHARHILVEKEDEAKALIAKLKAGAKFEELAKQSSKDPGSGANGGDLDWAPPSNYVPEFSAALQKLKKGEMTDTPVKTQFGYHIIKLDDTRQAQFPPFDQIKQQITESLQQKKLAGYQKQLKDAAKVQ